MRKNFDYILMSAPALAVGLINVQFSKMEMMNGCLPRLTGFFGTRICVITFQISALLVVIYAVFKSVFMNVLDLVTFKQIKLVRDHTITTDENLKILFMGKVRNPDDGNVA